MVSEGTRLPASSLLPLVRASTQVLQFTFKASILEGNLRVRTLHASLLSVLAARVGNEDLIDGMVSREKSGRTQKCQ